MTNKKKSILKRGLKLFKKFFYKSSYEDWGDYLVSRFSSIVFFISHLISIVMVYAAFGGLKGIFISVFLFSFYALFAFNAEYTLPIVVVAILFSIAFPAFTNINDEYKEQSNVAAKTLATIVKECSAKVADSGTGTYVVPALKGYTGWTERVNGNGLTVGSVESCHISSGVYEFTSSDTTQYPTWRYNVGTGEKTCVASRNALRRGCSKNGTW